MNLSDVLNFFSEESKALSLKKDVEVIATERIKDLQKNNIVFCRCEHLSSEDKLNRIKQIQNQNVQLIIYSNNNDLNIENGLWFPPDKWSDLKLKFARHFYPIKKDLKIIGITGTNGKTSSINLLDQALGFFGKKVLSVGTLGARFLNKEIENFSMTSPPLLDVYYLLNKYQEKIDYALFEVSSHALAQNRFQGIDFFAAGWTSFSQDHLDFHKTISDYFAAKAKIFLKVRSFKDVFLASELRPNFELYGPRIKELPEPSSISWIEKLSEAKLKGAKDFLLASFNRSNLALVFAILDHIGLPSRELDLAQLNEVPGRINLIPYKNCKVFIDFAHTPDALLNVCKSLRDQQVSGKSKLITLFGCGGNRDRLKRPLMAEAAERFSDICVLTSDNPRDEDPNQIIEDATAGFQNKNNHFYEVDRRKGIDLALSLLEPGDVLLIAGKGHETTMEIKGQFYPYNDAQYIKSKM